MPVLGRSYLPSRVNRSISTLPALRGPVANRVQVARVPIPRPHSQVQAFRGYAALRGPVVNWVQLRPYRPPTPHGMAMPFRAYVAAVPPVSTTRVMQVRYRAPTPRALGNSVSILNLPPPPVNQEVIAMMQIIPYRFRRRYPSRVVPYRLRLRQ